MRLITIPTGLLDANIVCEKMEKEFPHFSFRVEPLPIGSQVYEGHHIEWVEEKNKINNNTASNIYLILLPKCAKMYYEGMMEGYRWT